MYAEPDDIDRRELSAILETEWRVQVSDLRYAPVGFGSHHYAFSDGARTWFVTVDDLTTKGSLGADEEEAFAGLERALVTALVLRRAGLEFVHAPIERTDGNVLARLGTQYAVSVFTFVDGTSEAFGEYASIETRRRVLQALGRMHATREVVPARSNCLELPWRGELAEALAHLDTAWSTGPYAEPARRLLSDRAADVHRLLSRYDELSELVGSRTEDWVVTHGEPHAANVMTLPRDGLVLIDWDTVAYGPRERDLWMVEPRDDDDWAAYTSAATAPPPDPNALQLFRRWWQLSEIAGYTAMFRAAHTDDANTRLAWTGLQQELPADAR